MLFLPVIFFGLAAIGGAVLVSIKAMEKNIPLPLAILHGVFAVIGIGFLIKNVIANPANIMIVASLALFLAAVAGGITLFSFQLRKKPLPVIIIEAHVMTAVIAFTLLVVSVAS